MGIYIGSVAGPGQMIPQEGAEMITNEWGFDTGRRSWLTHPSTVAAAYPQRDQRDSVFTSMFVRSVTTHTDPSTLILVTASYKGLKSIAGGINKQRVISGADTQSFSIPVLSSGDKRTLIAQVPNDTCTREYVTTSGPTRSGVGQGTSGAFLGGTAGFSITFVLDPDASPPPLNYNQGWILEDRSWEDVAGAIFLVKERYRFYYSISG
jgi:hypothetical protein